MFFVLVLFSNGKHGGAVFFAKYEFVGRAGIYWDFIGIDG